MDEYQNFQGQILGENSLGQTKRVKVGDNGVLLTSQQYETLVETFTEVDAIAGVLTFAENIDAIEIFNVDATNIGTFLVNGLGIVIPPSTPFKTIVGGIANNVITITGSTAYIVNRYI